MDNSLAERVAGMEHSKIRVMFDMAEVHDGDLVRLEVGEPDFVPPKHVTEAAVAAARGGEVNYTSNTGIPELREAIADRLATDHDMVVDPEEVVVAPGEGFGDAGQGHVRLSFASSPEDLHEGLDGIEALVREELE